MLSAEIIRRPTVAIVNDDRSILDMLGLILGDEGYRVVACEHPDRAHAVIKASRPNLAIVDVRMHGAPDWHVLDVLKRDEETASIPVLVCSASTAEVRAAESRLRELGCESIEMPFDIDEILGRVRRLASSGPRSQPGDHPRRSPVGA